MSNKPCTHEIVQEAMRIVSKDVISPKYVRNMSKIITAEEFLKSEYERLNIRWASDGKLKSWRDEDIIILKNFAKLHVEAALKEIYKKAKKDWKDKSNGYSYQDITEQSIINAYDLNNIK